MIQLFNINDYVIDTSTFDHCLHGSIVEEFENKFCEYVGAKYACSLSSATNAIFLSFLDKQKTVTIPSMIPAVVPNALINAGNNIVFSDDTEWVGSSYVLHDFGNYKIIDSAQRVDKNQFKNEAEENDLMIFSFYPTKPIGSFDGGMIVSNDFEKIKWFKEAALNGMSFSKNNWNRKINFVGWKMYMNSLQAYVALQNFNKLEDKKVKLKQVRDKYNLAFGYNNTSDHLYRIKTINREEFIQNMRNEGINCGIHYSACHLNPIYKKYSTKSLLASESEEKTTVSIPYNESLSDLEVEKIINCVKDNLGDTLF